MGLGGTGLGGSGFGPSRVWAAVILRGPGCPDGISGEPATTQCGPTRPICRPAGGALPTLGAMTRQATAPAVTFGVLGPVEAVGPEGRFPLKGPRQRAVLARLLVARGRVVPVDRL